MSPTTGGNSTCLGHHGRIPRWVPDDFDIHVIDAFQTGQRILDAPADTFVHGAAGRCQCHGDFGDAIIEGHAVNQSEVNNIAADFRVNYLMQCIENGGFHWRICSHVTVLLMVSLSLAASAWDENNATRFFRRSMRTLPGSRRASRIRRERLYRLQTALPIPSPAGWPDRSRNQWLVTVLNTFPPAPALALARCVCCKCQTR